MHNIIGHIVCALAMLAILTAWLEPEPSTITITTEQE